MKFRNNEMFVQCVKYMKSLSYNISTTWSRSGLKKLAGCCSEIPEFCFKNVSTSRASISFKNFKMCSWVTEIKD